MRYLLLTTVFVISTCGLIYELVAGSLASYLLGDSVTQFSTVIGSYLFAMGIGSWLSGFIQRDLISTFIRIEILTGLIGGLSSAILFVCFGYNAYFRIVLYLLVGITGLLVGMEIPLIMRILRKEVAFKKLVSHVFTFDYIGALLASIAFPVILVPHLNLMRTSILFGLFNIGLAIYLIYFFKTQIKQTKLLFGFGMMSGIFLVLIFAFSDRITSISESAIYGEHILYSTTSPYQRIVITRERNAYSMFLNNHLQFNTRDEYRYHEALVHPAITKAKKCTNVLVLGGGDGFAVREILKHDQVKTITLVDLDKKLTDLFQNNSIFKKLNGNSLLNRKLKIIHDDAFRWLQENQQKKYDVIIIDFPDPTNYSVGKLYTLTFYKYLQSIMHSETKCVIQSTSPLYAKESFWCINQTIRESGLDTRPYHAYVPSFGEWGYIMCGYDLGNLKIYRKVIGLRFYSEDQFNLMQHFPTDMKVANPIVNRLNNQALIPIFEREWDDLFD